MGLFWTTCIVLAAAFFSARGVPLKEDPLATKAKQIVANVNSFLEENKYDQAALPDLGDPATDDILLTNVKMSKLSSMVLVQGPLVVPQNQSQYLFYVEIGLNEFKYQFDFDMNNTDYQDQGHFSIAPRVNSFIVKATVELSQDKSCSVSFRSVDLYQYGDYEIELQPNDIPNKDEVIEDILRFSSPFFLTWFNKAVEDLSSIPSFSDNISNIVCQVLVS